MFDSQWEQIGGIMLIEYTIQTFSPEDLVGTLENAISMLQTIRDKVISADDIKEHPPMLVIDHSGDGSDCVSFRVSAWRNETKHEKQKRINKQNKENERKLRLAERNLLNAKKKELKERKEFERLKKKFG